MLSPEPKLDAPEARLFAPEARAAVPLLSSLMAPVICSTPSVISVVSPMAEATSYSTPAMVRPAMVKFSTSALMV